MNINKFLPRLPRWIYFLSNRSWIYLLLVPLNSCPVKFLLFNRVFYSMGFNWSQKILISIFLIANCLLPTANCFADQNRIDSLKNIINNVSNNKKIEILIELSDAYVSISLDTSLYYANKAYKLAKEANDKKNEAEALKKIGIVNYYQSENEKSIEYFKKSLKIYTELIEHADKAIAQKSKKEVSNLLNNIGILISDMGNYKEALGYYKKSIKIDKEFANSPDEALAKSGIQGIGSTLNNIGNLYMNWSNYDKAIEYYKKSLKIAKKIDDKQRIANSLNNIGIVYHYLGDYKKTIEYYQKALNEQEELNNKKNIAGALNNIGTIYYDMKNYKKAMEYFQKAIKIAKESGNKQILANVLLNIGIIYDELGNYEKAIKYLQKSLTIYEDLNNKSGIATSLITIGNIYQKRNNYEKAQDYFFKSLKIRKKIEDKYGIAACYINIGSTYNTIGEYKTAVYYLSKGLKIAQEIGAPDKIKGAAETLSEAYSKLKQYEKAYQFHVLYKQMSDSLINEDNIKKLTQMEMQYGFDKKQKQQEFLQKQKETAHKAELKRQKLLRNSFITGFALMLLLAFVVFRSYRIKQKANKLLAQQNIRITKQKEEITSQRDEIEVQRNTAVEQRDHITRQKQEITDSIIYAERIQKAVLPDENYTKKILGEHFILFKPKDIVSGDFYWAAKIKNWLIVAAVDCTGHGVPGAFMSMLGVSFLNEIVNKDTPAHAHSTAPPQHTPANTQSNPPPLIEGNNEKSPLKKEGALAGGLQGDVLQANEILNQLREEVIKSLHQTGKEGEAKDGMDIALCVLDTTTNKLQFSGAYNSLYIVRKVSEEVGNKEEVGSRQLAVGNKEEVGSQQSRKDGISAPLQSAVSNKSEIPNSIIQSLNHSLIEIKADRMPIGIYTDEIKLFTNHEIQLSAGDTIYIFSDGYTDQFGGPQGKKFKSKPFKQLLVDIHKKDMAEQKEILDRTFKEWKGNLEQVDDVLVMGIRI